MLGSSRRSPALSRQTAALIKKAGWMQPRRSEDACGEASKCNLQIAGKYPLFHVPRKKVGPAGAGSERSTLISLTGRIQEPQQDAFSGRFSGVNEPGTYPINAHRICTSSR
jgi:hypothetical protein